MRRSPHPHQPPPRLCARRLRVVTTFLSAATLMGALAPACGPADPAPDAVGAGQTEADGVEPGAPSSQEGPALDAVDATGAPDVADAAAGVTPAPRHEVPIGAADMTFLAGPWITQTTGDRVSMAWETEAESDTRLELGVLGGAELDLEFTGSAGLLHQVEATGLEPATVYRYRACSGAICTGELTLATGPGPGQAFRFVVYGDSRSDPPQHALVAASIIESAPSVVLHTGDIVEHGAERPQYREMHLEPTRRLGQHVPLFVAIGNHEWKDLADEVQNFRDYLPYPREETHQHPGLSYAVRYGDAYFLVLDNTLDGLDLFFPLDNVHDQPLWAWIKEAIHSEAAQTARWRFAFFHYPPGSPCHEDWPMILATRDHLLPALREARWDAIFAGHVHNYERHDFDGLPVIITGGGGAGLEPLENCTRESDTLVRLESVHHHVRVDLSPESAWIEAVDLTGEVFDMLELSPSAAAD